MVNELLNIIDRFIKIKEYRNQKVQKTYEQLLEPVFNDLMLIHNDYIKMFEKVLGLLRSYQIPFDKKGKTFTSKEFNKIFFPRTLGTCVRILARQEN